MGASHILRERRIFSRLVNLEQLESLASKEGTQYLNQRWDLERIQALIQQLKPLDRQIILYTSKTSTPNRFERSQASPAGHGTDGLGNYVISDASGAPERADKA